MRPRPMLFLWLMRETLLITGVAVPAACAYVLTAPEVLEKTWSEAAAFILVHALALSYVLGRYASGAFAFLYTRGYSRPTLWWHLQWATLASVAVVWAPAGLLVWLDIRTFVQDRQFASPQYPLMAELDRSMPWVWLAQYLLLIPVLQYAWMRQSQPTRGTGNGLWLAVGVVLAAQVAAGAGRMPMQLWGWLAADAAVLCLVLVLGTRCLNQRMEVRR